MCFRLSLRSSAFLCCLPYLVKTFSTFRLAVEIEIRIGVANHSTSHGTSWSCTHRGESGHVNPTALDRQSMATMPPSLGLGERESIAICKRLNSIFVSNERRVKHHCRDYGVDCVNLVEILRALWELGILKQADVRNIIAEIEARDNLKFRAPDTIFK